jgi:hypothetical protein
MNRIVLSTTLALAAAAPLAVRAQNSTENLNRFSFGPTFGINLKADFQNNTPFLNNVNPGPAAGGANHTYNDGYVLVDSSGDAGGLTQNWGYQNASQYNPAGTGTMQFNAIQSGGSSSSTDNPQYGGEFVYQRVIGPLPSLSGDWGFEFGFGFTDLNLRSNLGGTVPVITDSYQLNGVIPPGPGYQGTFNGPGPLLGDTPTRSATSATVTGHQKLSGQLFSFRLGPFAEWNLTTNLSLAASVGITLAPAIVDYDFSETYAIAGGGVYAANDHSSETRLLYGPYAGAMLRYDFNKCWGVYFGARFQNLNDLNISNGGSSARLDQSATLYATAGVTWKF